MESQLEQTDSESRWVCIPQDFLFQITQEESVRPESIGGDLDIQDNVWEVPFQ